MPMPSVSMRALCPAPLTAFLFCAAVPMAMLATGCASRTSDPLRLKWKASAEVMHSALPGLKEGDIIFTCAKNVIYRKIAQTFQSWESHVGILFCDSSGGWKVAESTLPITKFTPLDKFLLQSEDGRFVIRRLRAGLSQEETPRLRVAVESRMGKLYDLGFQYDSSRLYCSKFVYDTFLEATGQRIGRIETFREMFEENPGAPVSFWRAWFFGRIPWERRTVTTTSQLHSANLVTVFDSEKRAR